MHQARVLLISYDYRLEKGYVNPNSTNNLKIEAAVIMKWHIIKENVVSMNGFMG